MKPLSYSLCLAVILLIGCSDSSQFRITQDAIGDLSKTTTMRQLDEIFKNDSLVKSVEGEYTDAGTVTIYEKGGKRLLFISPKEADDTSGAIGDIRVFDERYVTDKGIGLNSTFKDITDAYVIRRIDNLLDSIVIFLDDSDIYITIDKKHLPGEFMFDTSKRIEAVNIPDDAPIKYLMIGW